MSTYKMFRKNSPYLFILALVLGASLAVGVSVWATSIGTNVSVSGTLTSTGNVTFNGGSNTFGDAGADINLFTGTLHASTSVLLSPPVTLYNNLTVGTSTTFFVDAVNGRVGVGTSTPSANQFSVHGNAYISGDLVNVRNVTATGTLTVNANSTFGDAGTDINLFTGTLQASTTVLLSPPVTAYNNLTVGTSSTFFVDAVNGRVGVGTSTPSANAFSVHGNAYISGNLVNVQNITATGTVTIGANGTAVNSIIHGFCDFGMITNGQTIAATSTGAVGCTTQVPAGLAAGDKIWLTASSTGVSTGRPGAFDYTGIASSTSTSRIQALIYNTSGADYTVATTTWQYFIIK